MCLFVTMWYHIQTIARIEMFFWHKVFLSLTLFYGNYDTSENKGTSLRNIVPYNLDLQTSEGRRPIVDNTWRRWAWPNVSTLDWLVSRNRRPVLYTTRWAYVRSRLHCTKLNWTGQGTGPESGSFPVKLVAM